MPRQRIPSFDHAGQEAHTWINEINKEMNHPSRVMAYHALRGVLHTLRDRLPVNEAHHLAAQLPLIIRGLYFEAYRPAGKPVKMHHAEFLEAVSKDLQAAGGASPEAAVHAVLGVLASHVSAGELDHVSQALPADLQALWGAPEPA